VSIADPVAGWHLVFSGWRDAPRRDKSESVASQNTDSRCEVHGLASATGTSRSRGAGFNSWPASRRGFTQADEEVKMAFSITALTPQTTANNAATTYGTVTYGTCDYVIFGIIFSGTANSVSSLTLNGVSGVQVGSAFANGSANGIYADTWSVPNPGGTSGALVINYAAAMLGGTAVQPWAIISTGVTAPSAGAENFLPGSGTACSASIVVPSGGGVVGVFTGLDAPSNTLTWTNITLDNTTTWAGKFFTVEGISGHATGGTGASVTVTGNSVTNLTSVLSLAAVSPGSAVTLLGKQQLVMM
jgi:hypothetical protein